MIIAYVLWLCKKKKTNDKIIHNLKKSADPFLEKFKKYFMCRTLFTYITLRFYHN